jgi:hypothetical protein
VYASEGDEKSIQVLSRPLENTEMIKREVLPPENSHERRTAARREAIGLSTCRHAKEF